jgi:hypothetical protein
MSNKVLCRDLEELEEVITKTVASGYSYCVVGRTVYYWR